MYYNMYYYPAVMMYGGRFDPVTLSVNMNFYLYKQVIVSDWSLAVSFSPLQLRDRKLQSVTGCRGTLNTTGNAVSKAALPVARLTHLYQIVLSEGDSRAHSEKLVRTVHCCQRFQCHPGDDCILVNLTNLQTDPIYGY
jgi:hypothetical protein